MELRILFLTLLLPRFPFSPSSSHLFTVFDLCTRAPALRYSCKVIFVYFELGLYIHGCFFNLSATVLKLLIYTSMPRNGLWVSWGLWQRYTQSLVEHRICNQCQCIVTEWIINTRQAQASCNLIHNGCQLSLLRVHMHSDSLKTERVYILI